MMGYEDREAHERIAWNDKLVQADVDALVAKGRLRDLTHRHNGKEWIPTGRHPTAAEVNARQGLGGFHDAINRHICIERRCKALGITPECPTCDGNGDVGTPKQRQAIEDWRGTDPPGGPGWQLWETVSEGSPVSPVFASANDLAAWIVEDGQASSVEVALRFIDNGSAFTFVSTGGEQLGGIEFAGRKGLR
jgi:hypothetical protein